MVILVKEVVLVGAMVLANGDVEEHVRELVIVGVELHVQVGVDGVADNYIIPTTFIFYY